MAMQILLFGDVRMDTLECAYRLTQSSKQSSNLREFLRKGTDVLQIESAALGTDERHDISGFEDFRAIVEATAQQKISDEMITIPLMCLLRLGELILYVEKEPCVLASTEGRSYLLGISVGLLPAVAALMSKTVVDLFGYGLEIIAVSVRLGHELRVRTKNVAGQTANFLTYGVKYVDYQHVRCVLESFHQRQGIPPHQQAYLGLISNTEGSLFGPQPVLSRFWNEHPMYAPVTELSLTSALAVHAPHLPKLDTQKVVGRSTLLATVVEKDVSLVSSGSRKGYPSMRLDDLLHQILEDIGNNAVEINEALRKLTSELSGAGNITLVVPGSTPYTTLVREVLQNDSFNIALADRPHDKTIMQRNREGSNLIAIVGMSGRFPGGEDLQKFWATLAQGRDVHEQVPISRFDLEVHFDKQGITRNTATTPYGCFLERPELFDHRIFRISPKEALQMDPIQRILLMVTYEALQMAGYTTSGTSSTHATRIGTYIGQTADDWRDNNESQGIGAYQISGTNRAFTPGRLNHHFGWEGGSYSFDTACTSSVAAINAACSALLARECDTAVTGGGNLLTSPQSWAGLSRGGFLSKTGNCKTFRDDADGYCRGEGVGVVILKRLEDARLDRDNIQAVINAYGKTHAKGSLSIVQPNAESQRRLYAKILKRADVSPTDIHYVEMHGTGTQAGDVAETESVKSIFGVGRTKDNPLFIGAVKANIGHGEGAAGIASLIKSVLMLREGRIPPHPGMPFPLNHKFSSLEEVHMRIPGESIVYNARPNGEKRRIFLNNFDASGGNTGMIIEDNEDLGPKKSDPRLCHVVVCSGHTEYSLNSNRERLIRYLESNSANDISDVAYTTTARQMHHILRNSFVVRNTRELIQKLKGRETQKSTDGPCRKSDEVPVVWLFTGHVTLYTGMGRQLFLTCARFREKIYSYQRICNALGLPYALELISGPGEGGPEKQSLVQEHLAIVILEVALADMWKLWGITPTLILGHSLGEFAALCVSGVLSITDTLFLVGKRATLIELRCHPFTHAMLAVNMSSGDVENIITTEQLRSCEIACENAPKQTVISGTNDDIKLLERYLINYKAKAKLLSAAYGFHSAQEQPVLHDFEAAARGLFFAPPSIPVVSTVTAALVDDIGHFNPTYLRRQVRGRVKFLDALLTCSTKGLVNDQTVWFEFGPDPVCLGLVQSSLGVNPGRIMAAIKSTEENWVTLSKCLAKAYEVGIRVDWTEYHKEYQDCLRLVELPAYAFDMTSFWTTYDQMKMGPGERATSGQRNDRSQIPATPFRTCLQYLTNETRHSNALSLKFTSSTSEPNLHRIIQGHRIDGVAICPLGVFCEVAYSAATYTTRLQDKSNQAVPIVSLHDLVVGHPLVVSAHRPSQDMEVQATKVDEADIIDISFRPTTPLTFEYGSCRIRSGERAWWRNNLSRHFSLVKKRIRTMTQNPVSTESQKLFKPLVYKLFSDLVGYTEDYQALEEVILDAGCREAVATIKLQPTKGNGSFTHNPCWLDGLLQLAGFVLNGDPTRSNDVVFISTGFQALYILEELNINTGYTAYVCMQDDDPKDLKSGDIWVCIGDSLVVLCEGVRFKRMHRKSLAAILKETDEIKVTGPTQQQKCPLREPTAESSIENLEMTSPGMISCPMPSGAISQTDDPAPDLPSPPMTEHDTVKDFFQPLLKIIASETGFTVADMEPTTSFSELGIDSIVGSAVIAAARSQIGIDLPAEFFVELRTIEEAEIALARLQGKYHSDQEVATGEHERVQTASPLSAVPPLKVNWEGNHKDQEPTISPINHSMSEQGPTSVTSKQPLSRVVLLHGQASSVDTPVYLVPDGAGSASAYLNLPALLGGRRLLALESPFLRNPQDWQCTIGECTELYIRALQGSQAHGPYIIGGWSAGAIFAYEICRQLLQMGEKVKCLLIIDMVLQQPMLKNIEPTLEVLEQIGLFTGIERSGQSSSTVSSSLKEHFSRTVKAVADYKPRPMDVASRPGKSCLIWANRSLRGHTRPLDREGTESQIHPLSGDGDDNAITELKETLFGEREDYGPNGWDDLVGPIQCHVIDADHFSIVCHPSVKQLGEILEQVLNEADAEWSASTANRE